MISVIIVTYNSGAHIGRCLESLAGFGLETLVVDNASGDGSADLVRRTFPKVCLLTPSQNLGFAAACNLGARQSTGDVLLFLNPDAVCLGPLSGLEEALNSSAQLAAVAPRLVDAQGRVLIGFNIRSLPTAASLIFEILLLNRLFPNNPVNRRYRCLNFDYQKPAEVEQPAGACWMVRRSAFEACGGFDEGFFPLWFEDVDLCYRLRERGGKILFCPEITFEHQGGHSVESLSLSEKQVYWYRNLLYYVGQRFPWGTELAVRGALLVGVALRMVAELIGCVPPRSAPHTDRGERMRAYWSAAKLSFMGQRQTGKGV